MADSSPDYKRGVVDGALLVLERIMVAAKECTASAREAEVAGDAALMARLLGGAEALTAFAGAFTQRLRELQEASRG